MRLKMFLEEHFRAWELQLAVASGEKRGEGSSCPVRVVPIRARCRWSGRGAITSTALSILDEAKKDKIIMI